MTKIWMPLLTAALGGLIAAGCGNSNAGGENPGGTSASASNLSGEIKVDGSSTVFPISQVHAEQFMDANSGVQVTVAESGTTGGFKKFLNGEIDITGASRPIDESEVATAKEKGVEFIEIPIAYDGLSVVVNPKNTFVDHLTVAELKKMWEPDSKVKTWADVRAGWPAQEIKLFGAGTDSGTFDYFTEEIVGKKRASRTDYTPSEDDNQLVQGVAGEEFGLGYFGFAYYEKNRDKLKIVPIDSGSGPITPNSDTIRSNDYKPLSRPIFLYVSKKSLAKPEVKAYLEYFFAHAEKVITDSNYIPLNADAYAKAKEIVEAGTTGEHRDEILGKK
jgi:phosphate transport system substrate-binding protein